MAMRSRACIGAVVAMIASLLFAPTSVYAAETYEVNGARQVDGLETPTRCYNGATFGSGVDQPWDYFACFRLQGDVMWVTDARADGRAGVMKWRFYAKKAGGGYASTPARQGICIYAGGSKPRYRSGYCNKDLPEQGALRIYAGYRLKSGSLNVGDMRFGSQFCYYLAGDGGLNDKNCLLLDP